MRILCEKGRYHNMNNRGKTILGIAVAGICFVGYKIFSFTRWLNTASKEELEDRYEEERQNWIKHGAGEYTHLMNVLNNAIRERMNEEWENDPNRDPNYRWTDENRWE